MLIRALATPTAMKPVRHFWIAIRSTLAAAVGSFALPIEKPNPILDLLNNIIPDLGRAFLNFSKMPRV